MVYLQLMIRLRQTPSCLPKLCQKMLIDCLRVTSRDAGDAHEVITEVDNWDLIVHRREATRVQNRRNVQVGSRENQPTPRTGKDGFLNHTRLGLVGWISYWSCGDSAQVVIILVVLIKSLGLTELVSDALGSRK